MSYYPSRLLPWADFAPPSPPVPPFLRPNGESIGEINPLPVELQQYASINITIPLCAAISPTDVVKFAVTSMACRTTALFEYPATVAGNGASVMVLGDDMYTQTPPRDGWYWFLFDTTTQARIAEGPLTLDPGPLVT